MTLDHLRYFSAAATYQHVGRAALASAISPSVISAAIATLEDELQCELFRKTGRRIELTSDGNRFFERCKDILSNIDGLKAIMKGTPEVLSGRYRLGASHFLSSRLLLSGWSDLQKKNPGLIADIYSMNTAHAIAEVISGRIDLAVCFSPLSHPDLKETRLLAGELVAVVKKGHPILKKSSKEQLQYLSKTKAVIHKSTQGVESCESHPIFEAIGFQPQIDLYFDSDDTAIQRICKTDSWSFVPDVVLETYKNSLQKIPLPRSAGRAPYHVSALVHRERTTETTLQALQESLKSCCPRVSRYPG